MNYRVIYSDELYHYGVKGMRWGVRKEYVPKGRKKSSGEDSSEKKKRKGLTRNQKIALGVAAVAVTGVVLYKTGQFDRIREIGKKAAENQQIDTTSPRISKWFENSFAIDQCSTSKAEDLKLINSDLGISSQGLKDLYRGQMSKIGPGDQAAVLTQSRLGNLNNCTYCTTAAEMRRRGFDVVAGKTNQNVNLDKVMGWWKNPVVESVSGYKITKPSDVSLIAGDRTLRGSMGYSRKSEVKNITNKLLAYGEGARGNFLVSNGKSDHSVEFEVGKGAVKIFDNQTRMSFNSVKDFFNASDSNPSLSMWMRTDNLDPNLAMMVGQGVIKRR